MCYHISIKSTKGTLEKRFAAEHAGTKRLKGYYHVSGFEHPTLPIIRSENLTIIENYTWGLIPFWVNGLQQADDLKSLNLTAQSETIFEKRSFKYSIHKNRCIILVDGFFEWHEIEKKKYPYFIKLKDGEPFALGGIYNDWENKSTGEIVQTFSIITTKANPLMAKINNSKQRMPLILDAKNEKNWLKPDLKDAAIKSMMQPFDENNMEAYTVSKLLSKRNANTNVEEITEPYRYSELESCTPF